MQIWHILGKHLFHMYKIYNDKSLNCTMQLLNTLEFIYISADFIYY